ncbi:hypothetical protein B296_00028308 [Ensete ventricosum]|uniref:Uncharacterized protein n=1 Tax=Ensete ventricosum TaxID=4639 RepID=A0A426X7V3_ENSVE|nr:hypothetical protein B296_00028308 [Ensete ventricosum]
MPLPSPLRHCPFAAAMLQRSCLLATAMLPLGRCNAASLLLLLPLSLLLQHCHCFPSMLPLYFSSSSPLFLHCPFLFTLFFFIVEIPVHTSVSCVDTPVQTGGKRGAVQYCKQYFSCGALA